MYNNTPGNQNETNANLYPNQPNLMPVGYPAGSPQMVMPVAAAPQQAPVVVQPIYVQTPNYNDNQKVNVIVVEEKRRRKSDNCCYCRGPRQSPCGCLDPNEEYCCFLVCMAYVLMSLRYILMCLCILTMCRSLRRGGCW